MRRAIVTGTATVSGVVLLLGLKPHGATAQGTQSFSIGSSSGTASSSAPAPSSSASAKSSAKSGSSAGSTRTTAPAASATKVITGDAAQTNYGPVQLQVTFNGKKITNISVLQYPSESYRDQQINTYALPALNQEAISAQSAKIDVVSGATYTSEGYAQSLQSAIDKAGA
ncbi:MAG: FMN-binding protein [Actinocrinis sp.]